MNKELEYDDVYGKRFCSCGNKLKYEEKSNARGYGVYGYCDKCKNKEYVIEEFLEIVKGEKNE